MLAFGSEQFTIGSLPSRELLTATAGRAGWLDGHRCSHNGFDGSCQCSVCQKPVPAA